jgi:predicted HTH transcriptional regulator
MWIPRNEQEIEIAAENRSLEETVTFDAKREIPSKNSETAKDVSALANAAGGV